jgi:3-oxoacyl-[acyl-carrier-protein] synthase-1
LAEAWDIGGFVARTPLGASTEAVVAAVGAGISRVALHPRFVDPSGDPLRCAEEPTVAAGRFGAARVAALAEAVHTEAVACHGRLPCVLVLADIGAAWTAEDVDVVRRAVPGAQVSRHAGHAGALAALQEIDRPTLLLAVDSSIRAEALDALHDARRLHDAATPMGFHPGEAAFVAWVGPRGSIPSPLGRVEAIGVGSEPTRVGDDEVNTARAMTTAVRHATSAGRARRLLLDLNGERYRTEEWAFTALRIGGGVEDVTTYDAPADQWGDIGAATGLGLLACALQPVRGRHPVGPTLLVTSSDGGLRSAALTRPLP